LFGRPWGFIEDGSDEGFLLGRVWGESPHKSKCPGTGKSFLGEPRFSGDVCP